MGWQFTLPLADPYADTLDVSLSWNQAAVSCPNCYSSETVTFTNISLDAPAPMLGSWINFVPRPV
jgi:hypothetical protein